MWNLSNFHRLKKKYYLIKSLPSVMHNFNFVTFQLRNVE